jgi:hypothetical protein
MPLGEAHHLATVVEERLSVGMGMPSEVTTHLESLEDHSEVHRVQYYTGRPIDAPDCRVIALQSLFGGLQGYRECTTMLRGFKA